LDRNSQSRPLICDPEGESAHPIDISLNILTGSNLLRQNFNTSHLGRNASKQLEITNNGIFSEFFDYSEDEELLKCRINEFENQLNEIRRQKLDVENSIIDKRKNMEEQERSLEYKIAILRQKSVLLNNKSTVKSIRNISIISNNERNLSVKIEPKLLKDTFIDYKHSSPFAHPTEEEEKVCESENSTETPKKGRQNFLNLDGYLP
jgi:hypothetical protein